MTPQGTRWNSRSLLIAAGGLLVFTVFFLKNAWVDEQAYVTFRSIEQLFAGNGLRWNPHERVQAFTHPLWLALLACFRLVTRDLFMASLVASWLCSAAALLAAARLVGNWGRWVTLLILLVSSKSFFDFTSSGLETPLAYLLLCGYLLVLVRGRAANDGSDEQPSSSRDWLILNGLLAALLLVRIDLGILVGPAHVYAAWRLRGVGTRELVRLGLLGALPFILWTAFSLFYYGFPVPNPVYTKLGAGIPTNELFAQGFRYLEALVIGDGLTAFVILFAIGLAVVRGGRVERALAAGLALNIVYVAAIGGDYMLGRAFAGSYLVAALSLLRSEPPRSELRRGPLLAAAALALLLPGSPIMSDLDYEVAEPDEYGIGDQRGLLFPISSLREWLGAQRGTPFPNYRYTAEGMAFRATPNAVRSRENVGFIGYAAGTEPIVVDRLGRADPLLARLPCDRPWRIGHLVRGLPEGYLKTAETGEPWIFDPGIREFHEKLALITQADLLAEGRLTAILKMNLGSYDDLLDGTD